MALRHGHQAKLIDTAEAFPNGLIYRPDFLTPDEEAVLLAYIENLGMPLLQFKEFESKRHGISYEHHFPAFLGPLQNKIAKWLDVPRTHINEALVQDYPPGYGIGWHRDRETPLVVGVSFKSWARMRFRPLSDIGNAKSVVSFEVEPRSVYVMQKEIATRWQHSIAPVEALRYSITFRMI
jgi:alkylated DNA repair dioxygenase AlkB